MATSKEEIAEWLRRGKDMGATHVVVVCDTFELDDYPVYVCPDDEKPLFDVLVEKSGNMQKVEEVYNLSMDLQAQLDEPMAYHL